MERGMSYEHASFIHKFVSKRCEGGEPFGQAYSAALQAVEDEIQDGTVLPSIDDQRM
jgi:hypothetical protein